MCGVVGFVATAPADAPAMLASIGHRGPDASGTHRAEIAGRQVFLGHARLSIIDLSPAGNQPMFAAGGQVALVFNGEVYNFQQLRERHLRDVPLRSRTDTEVVLRLYEAQGLRSLDLLNGDFAIAILDERVGKLYLVRDRAGVKPLYYAQVPGGFFFGSEIKALLAGGVSAELAAESLQRYFVFKYSPGCETLFRGISRVPPGHYLEHDIASGATRLVRYWNPDFSRRSASSYAEAQEELRGLLRDATTMRLVADVPVGSFLSGGMDSSIIAGLLRGNEHITHYCATQSSSDPREDGVPSDWHYAQRLAANWRLRLQGVDVGDGVLTADQIRTTVRFGDDLIADAAQIPAYLITHGAAATSKVFLSGMGADEVFLGYAGHRLALAWQYLDRLPLPAALLRSLGEIDQRRGAFKAFRRYLYKLARYSGYPAWRFGIFSIIGDFESSARVVPGDRRALEQLLAEYFPEGEDPFESFKRFEYENFLQKNLAYVDRMSMANSVEVRVPFLDHRVMEFAWSLPRSYKLSHFGRAKRILADAFSGMLPRYIIERRKAGFGMPIRSIFGSRERVDELLDLGALCRAAPLDASHVRGVIDAHVEGREDNSALIYALISFQEWHSIYFGHH
jgi:asparagine synthase (glutamine-hydrolysing)